MARLAQLKLSMTTTMLLVAIIFSAFLALLMYLFQLPLIYAIIGTIIFILLQYLIGPGIVKWSMGLRYLRPGKNPWLEAMVRDLAQKSGISMPKLAIVPDRTPSAFVFGRSAGGATLAVHEGLLTELNQEEIQGVIGHELGHVKHKDFLVIARGTFEAARVSGRAARGKRGEGSERPFWWRRPSPTLFTWSPSCWLWV